MTILVTGANGQLGNEMRIISKGSSDKYIFTDVNQVEGTPFVKWSLRIMLMPLSTVPHGQM